MFPLSIAREGCEQAIESLKEIDRRLKLMTSGNFAHIAGNLNVTIQGAIMKLEKALEDSEDDL